MKLNCCDPICLQQTSNIVAQKKFNPARDPCSVLWDVLWDDLVIMELTHGKKDGPDAPPSRLILYLKARSPDYREQIRKIKCSRDTHQAQEVYSAIELAMNTYGPAKLKVRFCDSSYSKIILPRLHHHHQLLRNES